MNAALRPILELLAVIPGLLLAYFPVKPYLKQPPGRLALRLLPLMAGACIGGGLLCFRFQHSTAAAQAVLALAAALVYIKTLRISRWKSGTIALSVCAVFTCINSISRAVNAAILIHAQAPWMEPWLCLSAGIFYNAACWLFTAAAYYPSTHAVRTMVEDDHFAQTWYVFWVLPLVFILLNVFMTPRYQATLQTGRVLQVYIVFSIALLTLLLCFHAIFLLMAVSLNRNARLRQENQLLVMQRQRYESLKAAIEEARQARHDLRHQLNQISMLVEEGDMEGLRRFLARSVSRIPSLETRFCENSAADSVVGYYCGLCGREGIPVHVRLDLPETLPVDEMDLCLVLSNLLENALEASLRASGGNRRISVEAYMHSDRLVLIQVSNSYEGEIREKQSVFQSSKRRGNGVGIQSVRRIAQKNGGGSTFAYNGGTFTAKVMLRGGGPVPPP